jgi:hypothetical protein
VALCLKSGLASRPSHSSTSIQIRAVKSDVSGLTDNSGRNDLLSIKFTYAESPMISASARSSDFTKRRAEVQRKYEPVLQAADTTRQERKDLLAEMHNGRFVVRRDWNFARF